MEFSKQKIFDTDFEIIPCSETRSRLIEKALKRDRSQNDINHKNIDFIHQNFRQKSQERTTDSLTPTSSRSGLNAPKTRSTTPNTLVENRPNWIKATKYPKTYPQVINKLNNFAADLWKSITNDCTYTQTLCNTSKSIKIPENYPHKDKYKQLISELSFIKVGKPIPTHLHAQIESLALALGIYTHTQTAKSKKTYNREKKLKNLVEKFTINKIKSLSIGETDEKLFVAFFIIVHNLKFDNIRGCGLMHKFVSNPGLAVKRIKSLPDMVREGIIDKGILYVDCASRSFNVFARSQSFSNGSGVLEIMELLEEIYFIFNLLDLHYKSTIGSYYPLSCGVLPENQEKKIQKEVENPFENKPTTPTKSIPSLRPLGTIKTHSSPNVIKKHENITDRDYTISKKILLDKFFEGKRTKTPDVKYYNNTLYPTKPKPIPNINYKDCILTTENSDKTDFPDNDQLQNNKTNNILQETKLNQIVTESRFYKRLEEFIGKFFHSKVALQPMELEKYKKDKDYSWKKLDYIKANTEKWIEECYEFLIASSSMPLSSLKRKGIKSYLKKPGYVDSLLFKCQSQLENKFL